MNGRMFRKNRPVCSRGIPAGKLWEAILPGPMKKQQIWLSIPASPVVERLSQRKRQVQLPAHIVEIR